jgi:hypothetical protein
MHCLFTVTRKITINVQRTGKATEAEGYRLLTQLGVPPSLARGGGRRRHDSYCDGSLKEFTVLAAALKEAISAAGIFHLYTNNSHH